VIVLASGGSAIADSGSSASTQAAAGGKAIPAHHGQSGPAKQPGQIPASRKRPR
jgi:hypothetical protein